jgi:bacillolysin
MPQLFKGIFSFFILFVLFSVTISQPIFAQNDSSGLRVVTDSQTGLTTFVGIDSASAGAGLPGATALLNGTPTAATALFDISLYARQFGLDNPGQELQFMRSSATQSGSRSFRYQQVYQGIPVIAGELIANYDQGGRLAALTGEVSPKLTVPTTPRLPATNATRVALGYVAKAENVAVTDLTASTSELWVYDPRLLTPETNAPMLVWRMEVRPAAGAMPIRYQVFVDAILGGVAAGFNQIDTAWHSDHAADHAITAQTIAASLPLPIVNAPLRMPNFATPQMRTYNSNGSFGLQGSGGFPVSTLVCNTPPTFLFGAGSCDGSGSITPANAAHFYAYNTFNYYDLKHQRDSIDDEHMDLISNVNYCEPGDCPYANAFWDGEQMVYGNGGFFTVDDVIAHELSHGVTEFTSGLFYFYESGAINEAMSDIFGEFVDQWNGSGNDDPSVKWLMGEQVTPFGPARNMANPTAFGDPDRTQSSLYWKFAGDGGGVHINSGIVNKTAYLMAQGGVFNGYTITALGNDKTSAIFYEVNSSLLTSGADFTVLAAAITQACNNILGGATPYNILAADCIEATEATRATELHLDPVAGVVFRPVAELCPANFSLENSYFFDDLEGGQSAFTSQILQGQGFTVMSPAEAWQDPNLTWLGPYAKSGVRSVFGASYPDIYDYLDIDVAYSSALTMNTPIVLPAGSSYYLHFDHSFGFEFIGTANFDGAVLEYTTNGGATWVDAKALFEAGQNYNGIIYNSPFVTPAENNPLAGRQGFIQTSHGYVSSRYSLKSLAGQSVRFRWRIGSDYSVSYYGWFVDNIQVHSCISNTAAPNRNYTDDTTPTLMWNRISFASKYELQIATNSTFTTGLVTYPDLPAAELSFDIPTPLTPGTYYWRVRAYDGVTPKAYSPAEAITIATP